MLRLLHTYGVVFFVAMVPVAELRGAIPAGIAMGLEPWAVWLVSIIGNMVPVPLIMVFIRVIFCWFKYLGGIFARMVAWLETKAARKASLLYRYELLGLMLLVAVPLPGTGAWTGALVASMLNIRLKIALPIIFLGVCIAGSVMLVLSCGISFMFFS